MTRKESVSQSATTGKTSDVPKTIVKGDKAAPCNHISCVLGTALVKVKPAYNLYLEQSLAVRVAIALCTIPILFLPALWFVMASPWLVLSFVAVYSAIFGVDTCISHVEGALKDHFQVKEDVF